MSVWHFILNALTIVVIDLLLAGDNALVIAMAVRSLPKHQRRMATILGAGAAVVLRVALTAVAARLLDVPMLKLAGGLMILWIGLKVVVDAGDPPDAAPAPSRIAQAIWYIVVADITMSLDNILAVAGASHGHVALIIFGLGLSIPLVIGAANLLSSLMDRYPVLIYIGAALLGKVGAEMILTDAWLAKFIQPQAWVKYTAEVAAAVAVVLAGQAWTRMRLKRGGNAGK